MFPSNYTNVAEIQQKKKTTSIDII